MMFLQLFLSQKYMLFARISLPLHQFIAQSMNRGTAHPVQVLNCF